MPKEPKKEELTEEQIAEDAAEAVVETPIEQESPEESELEPELAAAEPILEATEIDLPKMDKADDISFESVESTGDDTVTVKPVKFASFEEVSSAQGEINKNLDILMDIKLQLTVELGRTELPIKKVLELTRGSIIELEKVAGEPVELYANGKLVAHGEVVVIEDNFGLRITSITEPEDRIKGL